MRAFVRLLICCAFCWIPAIGLPQTTAAGAETILVRNSARSPAEVVEAIRAHVEAKKWVYMGASTVKPKQGDVTMVKVCIPQVGAALWPAGLHLSALLPCGNVGVYQNQGSTQVALLHPRYMQLLYPHPEVEKAVGIATPLLLEMLDTITR